MRSKTILALVLLNVMLLASLCFRNVFTRTASAVGPAGPSNYLMLPGELQGMTSGVIFIVDSRNRLLTVRALNGTKFEDMTPIDLNRVLKP